jgi:hypothetical protein
LFVCKGIRENIFIGQAWKIIIIRVEEHFISIDWLKYFLLSTSKIIVVRKNDGSDINFVDKQWE